LRLTICAGIYHVADKDKALEMLKTKTTVEQIVREVLDFLSQYIKVDRAVL